MIRLFSAALVAILMISCGGSPSGYPERDLIDQGVPLTIFAPEELEVQRSRIAFQEDVTLKGGDDFSVQIFISDAVSNKIESTLQGYKEIIESNPFFDGYVLEEESGFVYKNKIDSTYNAFGFRHIVLMGGKEYVFQEAMLGAFTEEQAVNMYEAVKGPKKK